MNFFKQANTERFTLIKGGKTNKTYKVRDFVYGVLVPLETHPLSSVSVSNSSFSIDLWTGCAWQCAYCHVQGTLQDIGEEGKMRKRPLRRNKFTPSDILASLKEHPFFVPDQSILSLGTASTEPFAPGEVCQSTYNLIETISKSGLKNPIWIITKAGIPNDFENRLAKFSSTNKLIISICYAGNPRSIEPIQNNRWKNWKQAINVGASLHWYLRPLVSEWGADSKKIHDLFLKVYESLGNQIEAIVPGGLRWTDGIEYGLTEVHNIEMPDIPKNDNIKTLSNNIWETILECSSKLFPHTPIFKKSSCALSYCLKKASITNVQVQDHYSCQSSKCPPSQRLICQNGSIRNLSQIQGQKIIDSLNVPSKFIQINSLGEVILFPPIDTYTYAVRQTIQKRFALRI